ncbi:MAG: hypothetical protein JXB85_13115 [Anaerolineales bacterium]|nr:hypothetical protein [Anaerolineales bacterium]
MKTNKTVVHLAILTAALTALAAGAGLLWQGKGDSYPFTSLRGEEIEIYGRGLYRYDSLSFASQAIAQDAATLILGVPLLVAGIVLAGKGSLRGQLLLTGTLGYLLYTYTTYAFLSAYNPLFLLYVTLFSLTLFAFLLAMKGLDPEYVARHIGQRFPRRGIAIFLMLLAGFLSLAWLGRIVPALFAGTPPLGLESYTTLVIQALDLAIIVPTSALAAVLLWRKRPWGYTLAAVLILKGLSMGAALVAMIIAQVMAGVAVSPAESVLFSTIAAAALIFTLLLFGTLKEPS